MEYLLNELNAKIRYFSLPKREKIETILQFSNYLSRKK